MSCANDFDCLGAQVCYANVSWLEPGEAICDCSNYYGWEGVDCTDLSIQGVVYLAFAVLFALANLLPFLIFAADMRFFLQVRAARDSNNTTLTMFYSGGATLFLCLYGAFLIGSLLSPKEHDVKLSNSDEKFSRFGQAERVTSILGVGLTILGSMNVSLMWIEVADRIRNYKREQHKHVYRYKNVIRLFQGIFGLALVVCIGFGLFFLMFLVSLPFTLIIVASYIRGRISFAKVLVTNELPSTKSNEYTRLSNRVKRTSSVVIFSIIGFDIFIGFFAVLTQNDWRNYSQPNQISYVVLGLNLAILCVIIWNLAIFIYARTSFLVFVEGQRTTTRGSDLNQSPSSFVNSSQIRKDTFDKNKLASEMMGSDMTSKTKFDGQGKRFTNPASSEIEPSTFLSVSV